ncbi:MAG: dTDP-4-dehydrorhamnose 3,5-epimerase [Anaerolineae bacterium]
MARITHSDVIAGVKFAELKVRADKRGHFLETFRTEWFPERDWQIVQTNCSYSRANVLRGLHYHLRQVDYWFAPRGTIRVALVDLRVSSPTRGACQTLEIGEDNPWGVFIPTGIAHGFVALTEATLTYLVDNYYDGTDEHGVAWNDPELGVDWGVSTPILSPRDLQNPLLKDIPPHQLPC